MHFNEWQSTSSNKKVVSNFLNIFVSIGHVSLDENKVHDAIFVKTKRLLKMVSTASLLGARHLGEVVENKSASLLVVSLGKALDGTPSPLCGRQVAQTPRKWKLPSECGHTVQNIAIQFAFS